MENLNPLIFSRLRTQTAVLVSVDVFPAFTQSRFLFSHIYLFILVDVTVEPRVSDVAQDGTFRAGRERKQLGAQIKPARQITLKTLTAAFKLQFK